MTNAEWMVEERKDFKKLSVEIKPDDAYIIFYNTDVISNFHDTSAHLLLDKDRILASWLGAEHQSALTDKERNFLQAMLLQILPCGSGHKMIRKSNYSSDSFCSHIQIADEYEVLADIKAGAGLFKEMVPDKWYTAKELGL